MIRWLAKQIIEYCEAHNKYWVITGRPNERDKKDVPYLVRYFVFRSKYFTIYIHRFLRSDSDGFHDHPWNFATLLLEGRYREHTFYGINKRSAEQNMFAIKKATDFHRVEIDGLYTFEEREQAPLTLFFHGPRKKDWGFLSNKVKEITANEETKSITVEQEIVWIPWWTYLGLPKGEEPWE